MFWITRAVFFGFGGLAVAGLLSYQHVHPMVMERLCGSGSGCVAVQASAYSKIGSIPVAWLGLVFYVLATAGSLVLIGLGAGKWRRILLNVGVIAGAAGVLSSLVLMGIALIAIKAFCPMCTMSAILCILWAWSIFRARREAPWEGRPIGAASLGAALAAIAVVGFLSVRETPGAKAQILARVNGKLITSLDLAREEPGALRQLNLELYDVKRGWLDRKIAALLVEQEAAARGVTVDEIFQELQKQVEPQYEALAKWIEQIRASNPQAWQIEATAKQEIHRRVFDQYVDQLRRKAAIEVYLERPPVALEYDPSLAHTQGEGPWTVVRLVLFSEFQCPYCAELAGTLDQVLAKYPDVSLTFVHMPMDFHEVSRPAAYAAECAAEQGRFWAYHDRLMKLQGQIEPRWEQYAKEVGLDLVKFRECMSSGRAKERVETARKAGVALKLVGVPALYMNGRKIGGAITFDELCALIEVERKRGR